MKKVIACIAIAAAVASTATFGILGPHKALANGNGQHFGPYATTNDPDSGTCGNYWATDNFKRDFQVTDNGSGNFTVVEKFVDGQFTTAAGASPGGCEPSTTPHGTLISAGVVGHLHGFEVINITGGALNPSGCSANACNTTAGFVAAVFGGGAAFTVPSFDFEYEAPSSGLLFKTWENASADQGGNSGDIATS